VLSFFFELGASCIRPVYCGLRPLRLLNILYLSKKKCLEQADLNVYLLKVVSYSLS
jgi:hypothetical protein